MVMTLGLLVLVSLVSYNPSEEPHGLQIIEVENAMGVAGVFISYWLIKVLFGYPAIVVPFLLIAWGWNRFRAGSTKKMMRATYYSLFATLYVATILGIPQAMGVTSGEIGFTYSGVVGGVLAQNLYHAFGAVGSIILLLAVGAIALIMAMGLSLNEAYAKGASVLGSARKSLKRRASSLRKWHVELPKKKRGGPVRPLSPAPPHVQVVDETGHETEPEPRWKRLARLREEGNRSALAPRPGRHPGAVPGTLEDSYGREGTQGTSDSFREPAPLSTSDQPPAAGSAGSKQYLSPPLELLTLPPEHEKTQSREDLLANADALEDRLAEFDVQGKVSEINPGPVITRYEYEPAPGIKVSRITALADDLALAMRAKRIRIVAPIPGKAAIGIELPNPEPQIVYLRSLLETEEFQKSDSPLTVALGKTISGQPYVTSLEKMPHLLIAGATGSGKSVGLNAIIASILYKAHPREVQFILVDPKRLELTNYRMLRRHHLNYREDLNEEVVTSAQNALAVMHSLEWEMESRYDLLARAGMRNIVEYNNRLREGNLSFADESPANGKDLKPLPYLVLVIDELADLMLSAAKEVEEPIARLTQLSRAVGIHLIVATQRPSVDVITGVIKANFPARIAFQVAAKIDSRTIIDMNGAEKLLGNGDMLFLPPGSPEPVRIHGAYVTSEDIERTIEHIRNQPFFEKDLLPVRTESSSDDVFGLSADGRRDELFHEALKLVVRHQQGSISLLQRRLKIGYSRAARLIDELEAAGIVGAFDGSKAREVLVDESYLEEMGLNS